MSYLRLHLIGFRSLLRSSMSCAIYLLQVEFVNLFLYPVSTCWCTTSCPFNFLVHQTAYVPPSPSQSIRRKSKIHGVAQATTRPFTRSCWSWSSQRRWQCSVAFLCASACWRVRWHRTWQAPSLKTHLKSQHRLLQNLLQTRMGCQWMVSPRRRHCPLWRCQQGQVRVEIVLICLSHKCSYRNCIPAISVWSHWFHSRARSSLCCSQIHFLHRQPYFHFQ